MDLVGFGGAEAVCAGAEQGATGECGAEGQAVEENFTEGGAEDAGEECKTGGERGRATDLTGNVHGKRRADGAGQQAEAQIIVEAQPAAGEPGEQDGGEAAGESADDEQGP